METARSLDDRDEIDSRDRYAANEKWKRLLRVLISGNDCSAARRSRLSIVRCLTIVGDAVTRAAPHLGGK